MGKYSAGDRVCIECGKVFTPWLIGEKIRFPTHSRTCSPECSFRGKCRNSSKVLKVVSKCETCGVEIVFRPSRKQRFCSLRCRARAPGLCGRPHSRVEAVCICCGDTFQKERARLERAKNITCSKKECRDSCRPRGDSHVSTKPRVLKKCQWCGKESMVPPHQVTERAKFCSHQCSGSASIYKQGGQRSSIEILIETELNKLGILHEPQKRIGRWLVDFYLPDYNLVIECDGIYWHSLPKNIERDARKDADMKKRGIPLCRLTELAINTDPAKALASALKGVKTIGSLQYLFVD